MNTLKLSDRSVFSIMDALRLAINDAVTDCFKATIRGDKDAMAHFNLMELRYQAALDEINK